MKRNSYHMPFAQWLFQMSLERIGAPGRILAIHAAVLDVTGNEELSRLTGLSATTLDFWKKKLKADGWVIIHPGKGGRGYGVRIEPAYHETPVSFTDIYARNPENFKSLPGMETPPAETPVSEETPFSQTPLRDERVSGETPLSSETAPAKPRVSSETPPADAPLAPRALALMESSLQEDTQQLQLVSEVKEEGGADAPSARDAQAAFELWNELALRTGLSQARTLTPQRRKSLIARMREHGGLEAWKIALGHVERSAFLQGENDRGWRADLDFLLQASRFAKVVDGGYGNGAHAQAKESGLSKIDRMVDQAFDNLTPTTEQRRLT